MSSHMALGPKAHFATNIPAIDRPMAMWAMSTSRPRLMASRHREESNVRLYAATASIRVPKM